MTSTFRLAVTRSAKDGATVTVTDNEDVIYAVRVNVCDEHDAMRRALAEAARFLAWYLDARGI
jgi:ribose 5-phosphate isomerase